MILVLVTCYLVHVKYIFQMVLFAFVCNEVFEFFLEIFDGYHYSPKMTTKWSQVTINGNIKIHLLDILGITKMYFRNIYQQGA